MQELENINIDFTKELERAGDLKSLEELRIKYLGKTGIVSLQMQKLAKLPVEEKKNFGANVNKLKEQITLQLDAQKTILFENELSAKIANEKIDVTLPVRPIIRGKIHPISQVMDEVVTIFANMGFASFEGPQIEEDFYNFTALNIPEHHPARQMQDSFYLKAKNDNKNYVLRTHTSSVQIRTMLNNKPPFKFIAAGRVYRSDFDMTHTPMFHQIEGLYIDKNINMGHLKSCLHEFLKAFFELDEVPLRLRPSFFPFTEPSAEVDIGCKRENGEITIGKGASWLEILGCGMVHPNVLKNVGIDEKEYQGFAFGIGIERLAMLKYNVPDLRSFFENDLRWLEYYGFDAFESPSNI